MIPQNGNILKFPVLPQNGMETVNMHLNKYFIEHEGVVEPQGTTKRAKGHKKTYLGRACFHHFCVVFVSCSKKLCRFSNEWIKVEKKFR